MMPRGWILSKGSVADDECGCEDGWMAGLLMMVNFEYFGEGKQDDNGRRAWKSMGYFGATNRHEIS